jgi:hypothetical protein
MATAPHRAYVGSFVIALRPVLDCAGDGASREAPNKTRQEEAVAGKPKIMVIMGDYLG